MLVPGHPLRHAHGRDANALARAPATALTVGKPDGRVLSDRAAQKIRRRECAHEYAERQLAALGARPLRAGQNPAEWLA